MTISKKVVLHFPKRLVDRPIVSRLVKDYNLDFNILKASVTQQEEGLLVMEITGAAEDYERGLKYLTDTGVRIQSLGRDVIRNEDRCTHCGVCVTLCPSGAFKLDQKTRRVNFVNEKCLACEICIKACPPRAMELHL
ncbi:MAG: NIL domain-containing protein [Chloroflexota bacterium]